MFPFLTIFIVFLVILTYYLKKSSSAQEKVREDFLEKERRANAVRKQDISKLDYITIPFEKIPQKLHTSVEESLFALADKPMVNLTGISNTDLKLTYGTANLAILSEYDTNFADMVALLPQYTKELSDAGFTEVAKELLEFAVTCRADSRQIYQQLAEIYRQQGDESALASLREKVQELPELTRIATEKIL